MWSASQRHVMICYKSYPKPCPVRTPRTLWWSRARQFCYRGASTTPITNFYKKQSSKKSISGFTRSILLRKYFYHENWDQRGAAADAHLYRDPYSVSRIKESICKLNFSACGCRGKVPLKTRDLWLGYFVWFFSESPIRFHLWDILVWNLSLLN